MSNTRTPLTSPTSEQMHIQQAIQALHMAQITDDYQNVVKRLAGELYEDVCRIFPDHLQMLYLLTHERRRQVWNAVIATQGAPKKSKNYQKESVALRRALLQQKSTHLLHDAYGEVPNSFEGLLCRLGPNAKHQEVYRDLFNLALTCGPKLRKQLIQEKSIDAELVKFLAKMPERLRSVKFVKTFKSEAQLDRFLAFLDAWKSAYMPDKEELNEKLYHAVHRHGDVCEVIRQIFIRIPFPKQTVPNCKRVTFLTNGCALEEASKRFDNCLAGLVPEAVRGDTQFYEWNGRAHAIVALQKKRGHWSIAEIKLRKNQQPAPEFAETIERHFRTHGVGENIHLTQLIQEFVSSSAFTLDVTDLFPADQDIDLDYLFNAA